MSQVYNATDGNFYYALQDNVAGQSPDADTLGERWRALPIPADLVNPAAFLAAAAIKDGLGQSDVAAALRAQGQNALDRMMERAARRDGAAQNLPVTDRG